MATYRNKSDETVQVGVGLPYPQSVDPDSTFEVPDDVTENYDLNARFVRVDVGKSKKSL